MGIDGRREEAWWRWRWIQLRVRHTGKGGGWSGVASIEGGQHKRPATPIPRRLQLFRLGSVHLFFFACAFARSSALPLSSCCPPLSSPLHPLSCHSFSSPSSISSSYCSFLSTTQWDLHTIYSCARKCSRFIGILQRYIIYCNFVSLLYTVWRTFVSSFRSSLAVVLVSESKTLHFTYV